MARSIKESTAAEPSASESVNQAPAALRRTRAPATATAISGAFEGFCRSMGAASRSSPYPGRRSAAVAGEQAPGVGGDFLILDQMAGGGFPGGHLAQDLPGFGGAAGLVLQQGLGEEEVVVGVLGSQRDGPPQLGD